MHTNSRLLQVISGDKAPDKSQGPLEGMLKVWGVPLGRVG